MLDSDVTVSVSDAFADWVLLSLTLSATVDAPEALGVPVSDPEELSATPAGNPVAVQVYGEVPPLAINVAEYGTPATPAGSEVVTIASGPGGATLKLLLLLVLFAFALPVVPQPLNSRAAAIENPSNNRKAVFAKASSLSSMKVSHSVTSIPVFGPVSTWKVVSHITQDQSFTRLHGHTLAAFCTEKWRLPYGWICDDACGYLGQVVRKKWQRLSRAPQRARIPTTDGHFPRWVWACADQQIVP